MDDFIIMISILTVVFTTYLIWDEYRDRKRKGHHQR